MIPQIDISELSGEHLWAIQYGRQEANKAIEENYSWAIEHNKNIQAHNLEHPEEQMDIIPVPDLYTDQSYLNWLIEELFNNKIREMIYAKEQMLLNYGRQLPQETVDGLLATFGVPPLISDYEEIEEEETEDE